MSSSLLFVALTIGLTVLALRKNRRHESASVDVLRQATADGLNEPPSLHPVIDDALCIGCGACVDACPEKQVLGLVRGKARLIGASHCVGHGACRTACPTAGIELVFGTATRGVDIPFVSPNYETNVPGIFIAGELGGMGLIRNAFEQGRQAIESVGALNGIGEGDRLDVVVVGAGPAGFAATLACKEKGLRSVTLEQDTLGGTIAHYPRGKLVMTRPGQLPLVGKIRFTETTKEELLAYFTKVEREHHLDIHYHERLDRIAPDGDGFLVYSQHRKYRARAVLLAIGRRGTPRKLGVPGEQAEKVVYRLLDPAAYQGRNVLVVGGGDSALEAANALAGEPQTSVTLSYRSEGFNRAKQVNRELIELAESTQSIRILLSSTVENISVDGVEIQSGSEVLNIPNDVVIVCAGGILPTPFLESLGIEVETKFGSS